MFLDKEEDIMNMISYLKKNEFTLLPHNSFTQKIMNVLREGRMTANNSHDALPPDYYSEKENIMFDVLRINDTEVRKGYNPQKMRERKIEREVRKNTNGMFRNDVNYIINSENPNEHRFEYYINQGVRVISSHLKNVVIWEREHPTIRDKGLLICDETSFFAEGKIFINPYATSEDDIFLRRIYKMHYPWIDENFMKIIYSSNLSFIVWYMPFRPHAFNHPITNNYPYIVVMDLRFKKREKLESYNPDLIIR